MPGNFISTFAVGCGSPKILSRRSPCIGHRLTSRFFKKGLKRANSRWIVALARFIFTKQESLPNEPEANHKFFKNFKNRIATINHLDTTLVPHDMPGPSTPPPRAVLLLVT